MTVPARACWPACWPGLAPSTLPLPSGSPPHYLLPFDSSLPLQSMPFAPPWSGCLTNLEEHEKRPWRFHRDAEGKLCDGLLVLILHGRGSFPLSSLVLLFGHEVNPRTVCFHRHGHQNRF